MRRLVILSVVAMLGGTAVPAAGHDEREVTEPPRADFPTYRDSGPSVVVCKPDSASRIATLPAPLRLRNETLLERCRFEHIQAAVTHVRDRGQAGTRILVLPGVYREEPSRHARAERSGAPIGRDDLIPACEEVASHGEDEAMTYAEEVTCPHLKNLVAVQGDQTPEDDDIACDSNLCDLQIEGTGGRPYDVIIDGKLRGFDNGIKADRAGGFYVKNLAAQHFGFNGIYIIETSGATVDDADGSYNHEYGFLSFLAWVRYENCQGRSNGDGMVYPGSSPDVLRTAGLIPEHRDDMIFSTEVRGCRGHHNEVGFSGTSGNAVWVHHNEWDHNIAGMNLDSFFPDHPGTPQNHALVEHNVIHSNNSDYYDVAAHEGVCSRELWDRDYEDGALCPLGPAMTGSGIINVGGNFNWYRNNRFSDNWRTSVYQFWVPAEVREGEPVPEAHFREECGPDGDRTCPFEETSHWNTYSGNRLAEQVPFGHVQPNGADFMWDLEGEGNCWAQSGEEANTSAAGEVTYGVIGDDDHRGDAPPFPDCTTPRDTSYSPVSSIVTKTSCATYDQAENPDPAGCDWVDVPPMPEGRQPDGPTVERLAGADRIGTAVLASREGYPSSAPTVVLARADAYPDALAGAPLAHARGGPLLLTSSGGLDEEVAAEIRRLGATTAILLGGDSALSPQVEADLLALGFDRDDVVRVGGRDRYETAVAIARNLPATDALVAKGGGPGDGWADALAASAAAALLERPILLTAPDTLPPATAAYLDEGDIEAVDIVGGAAAVSGEVEAQLARRLDEVERIAGSDRYATSLAVAEWAHQAGADPEQLWLATGSDWPDGIAAASAIAVDEGVLLLVGPELAGTPAAAWLDDVHPFYDTDGDPARVRDVLEHVRLLGGTAALPSRIEEELTADYGGGRGDAVGDRSVGNPLRHGAIVGDAVRGAVTVTERYVGATRLRAGMTGLVPGTRYHAALAPGACASPGAPVTFPDGATLEDGFTADAAGVGTVDATVFALTDTYRSVVIRRAGTVVACADLRGR